MNWPFSHSKAQPSWEVRLPSFKARALAVSRNSQLMAVGSMSGQVSLLKMDSGVCVWTQDVTHPNCPINNLCFGSNDSRIAVGCGARFNTGISGGLRVLETNDGQKSVDVNSTHHENWPKAWCKQVDFLNDGSVVALLAGDMSDCPFIGLWVWPFPELQEWSKLRPRADDKLSVGLRRASIRRLRPVGSGEKTRFEISPNGKLAIVRDELWNLTTTGSVLVYDPQYQDPPEPSMTRICDPETGRLKWDKEEVHKIVSIFRDEWGPLAFPTDDLLITHGKMIHEHHVQTHRLDSGETARFTKAFQLGSPLELRCSRDGSVIALSLTPNDAYIVWSLSEGRSIAELHHRSGGVPRLFELSSNGGVLVAAENDTVSRWSI